MDSLNPVFENRCVQLCCMVQEPHLLLSEIFKRSLLLSQSCSLVILIPEKKWKSLIQQPAVRGHTRNFVDFHGIIHIMENHVLAVIQNFCATLYIENFLIKWIFTVNWILSINLDLTMMLWKLMSSIEEEEEVPLPTMFYLTCLHSS